MKTLIISYSITGNNDKLASSIAKELSIDHVKITDPKGKITCGIILKHLTNRTPKVQPSPEIISKYDFIILCGPIWMGMVAAPLRAYFKYIKENSHKYAFVTLCGSAANENKTLEKHIFKKTGKEPEVFVQYSLTDLFQKDSQSDVKDIINYQATDKEIEKVKNMAVKELKNKIK